METFEMKTLIHALDKRMTSIINAKPKTKALWQELEKLSEHYDKICSSYAKLLKAAGSSGKGAGDKRKNNPKTKKANEVGYILADDELLNKEPEFEIQGEKHQFKKYQKEVLGRQERWQWYLKSRQIGFTFVFAYRMLKLAVESGQNCIWMSASKAQAFVARYYVRLFAKSMWDLDLKGGEEITLYKDGKIWSILYFRGCNASTGASYSGHLFFDEIFWVNNFEKVERQAKGIATHKKFMKIYFSTPSYVTHTAYEKWKGKYEKEEIKYNKVGDDAIYRAAFDLEYACQQGADEFIDIQQIHSENNQEELDQLYYCKFLDGSASLFDHEKLKACQIELADLADMRIVEDENSDQFLQYEYIGNAQVWLGFDPAKKRDNAVLIAIAIPEKENDPYVKVGEWVWNNATFNHMALEVEKVIERFHVASLSIDITNGLGAAVAELLSVKYAYLINEVFFTDALKQKMCNKMLDLINKKRFKFGITERKMINSFLRIQRAPNAEGSKTLIKTERTKTSSDHGDHAWATILACSKHEISDSSSFSMHFLN